jgi:4-hydroxy 2-oxovalerate aldolase
MFNILDCTFRDGGYNNNWSWDSWFVQQNINVLETIDQVKIIELGYRSPKGITKWGNCGRFRFCDDEYINYNIDSAKPLCVMIDLCEYIDSDGVNIDLLCETFKDAKYSPFTYVRVAAEYRDILNAAAAISLLKIRGYQVILNIMKVSTLDGDQINKVLKFGQQLPIDVLYFADSFGALREPFHNICDAAFFPNKHRCKIGMHYHNNLGKAIEYAYQLPESTRESIGYVDTTIHGCGRGAGNCDMVELLHSTNLISDGVKQKFDKLWDSYGYLMPSKNKNYAISAQNNIHPAYVVNMLKFGLRDEIISTVLLNIKQEHKYKYNPDVVKELLGENDIKTLDETRGDK